MSTADPGLASVLAWTRGRFPNDDPQIEPLSGDASTRRYFRVRLSEESRIEVLYPEPFELSELPFLSVRDLLASYGLAVPEVFEVSGERGLVELEDLGDALLQDLLPGLSPALRHERYREAILGLARLQKASLEGPRSNPCFGLHFDSEKLTWELDFFLTHFVGSLRGAEMTDGDVASIRSAFGTLSAEIAAYPRVLCHRDFHSRNLMWHREKLWWIDFQDARMGPSHYDLGSLLRDSYVDLDEAMVDELLGEFRTIAVPDETESEFRRRFDLVCVQRNLKALGTFGFMATVRGKGQYLDSVPRTLERVRANLARHGEFRELRRLLARQIPELDT